MDFFEKAHVPKNESQKKDSKTDENVKQQLKQMLEGYKQSDNKLIRKSENVYLNPQRLFDDSSSVSGFSDLNLTNSSNELDTSRGHDSDDDEQIYRLSETKDTSENKEETISCAVDSLDSISECEDVLESLSEDMSQFSDSVSGEDETDNISLISRTLDTTECDSETSESFDADGTLAMRIMQKLNLKKKNTIKKVSKKKNKKEKKSVPIEEEIAQEDQNEVSDNESNDELNEISINDQMETDAKDDESNNSIINSNVSSPFISVTATEIPNDSFTDLLGTYRHSTVKNMPSDIQTINSTTDTMFSTEVSENNIVTDIDIQSEDNENQEETEFDFTQHYEDEVITIDDSTMLDDTTQSDEDHERGSSMEHSEDFVNPIKVYYAKKSCILILQHPIELYIHGKVNIKALGGTTEVFGYTLKDEVCQVYAPNYNYAHCLRTVDAENAYYGLFSKLTSVGLSVHEAEEIVTSIGECDGVVCLTPLKSRQMDFVENNFAITDLFSKMNRNTDNSLRQTSEFLGCSLYLSRPWKCFEENASWRQAVKYGLQHEDLFYEMDDTLLRLRDCDGNRKNGGGKAGPEGQSFFQHWEYLCYFYYLKQLGPILIKLRQSRGIVCGGKGVGKSTFLRYCVNRLLSQGPVLVIDLDPGQAEFTVAGSVSATVVTEPLLGPNFTHLRNPDKMLYIGMINIMDNPRRYATAVSELVTYCRNHEPYQQLPWIVNTMGMCNAMGLKLITHIILHTQPTYLLQIDSKIAKKKFQSYLNPGTIKNLCNEEFRDDSLFVNVPDASSLEYSFFVCDPMENTGKKDFSLAPRDERYLNYLAYFGELLRACEEEALLGIIPYEVNFRDFHIGLNVRVAPEAVLKVINGKVVALCRLAAGDVSVFTLQDNPLLCLGHGLVRAVDYETERLFIITPCERLSAVNTLVYADWVPELRGQERCLPAGVAVPYRAAASRQQRQLMTAPRRRFNPLQLLKMSRSS